jgi:hypothetical protein
MVEPPKREAARDDARDCTRDVGPPYMAALIADFFCRVFLGARVAAWRSNGVGTGSRPRGNEMSGAFRTLSALKKIRGTNSSTSPATAQEN